MSPLLDALASIRDFFEAGGQVLYGILAVTVLMWTFIIERLWFLHRVLPRRLEAARKDWDGRSDRNSWFALQVRAGLVSEIRLESGRFLPQIKTLMAVLPLLGLLGTVTGMIAVFDVKAFSGTGNARLMAAGVSRATLPTMAGLVAALSGLYFANALERKARSEVERLQDLLVRH